MSDESRKNLWPDEDEWIDFFREHLCGHPELAEHVAHIWFALFEYLGQGPEGVRNARSILKQALRLTYPFTSSYRLAYGITSCRFPDTYCRLTNPSSY
ncbi:MAG TPA: hypothetical protein VI756_00810 [Blastocatellia bacterium]